MTTENKILKPWLVAGTAAFLFSKAMVYFFAYLSVYNYLDLDIWRKWDSGLYFDIVKNGHHITPCVEDPSKVCGNAGWAPLYSFIIRFLQFVFNLEIKMAAYLVTNLFYLLYLLVVSKMIVKSIDLKTMLLLLIAVIMPGYIYAHAYFPMSLCLLSFVLILKGILENKIYLVILFSSILVWSYSSGFFIIPILFLYYGSIWVQERNTKNFYQIVKGVLPSFLSFLGLLFYDKMATGKWNAMFLTQEKYGHSLQSPIKLLGIHFNQMINRTNKIEVWIDFQNVLMFCVAVLFVAFLSFSKKQSLSIRILLISVIVFFWLLPYSLGQHISLYRGIIMLSPLVIFLQNYSWKILVPLAVCFLIFAFPMAKMFLLSILV